MAVAHPPGPLGISGLPPPLDDGTRVRALSSLPGPVGLWAEAAPAAGHCPQAMPMPPRPQRRPSTASAVPLLRQGSRGPEVERLQRLVNLRCLPSPGLRLDGVFGPITQRAVEQFQTGASIRADGVVGKDTWFHLLQSGKAIAVQAPARPVQPVAVAAPPVPRSQKPAPAAGPAPALPAAPAARDIADWPLADKFSEALRRTAPLLPASMQQEFLALLSPASLAIIAGTLVVWAGSHAFGVGQVVDLVLLAGGAIFLGLAVFDVAGELGDFLLVTSHATESRELDDAAAHLARAIAIIGVAAFVALLAKAARGAHAKGSPKGGTGEPVQKAPLEKPRPAKPAAEAGPVREVAPAKAPATAPVKFGQRRIGKEAGAEPPTKALLQQLADAKLRDVPAPPEKAGWPQISATAAATFKNTPQPIELGPRTKVYRVIDGGEKLDKTGSYWTTTDPRTMTEAQWRSGNAVRGEWNGDGAFVEYEVPAGGSGLKVWAGESAPQWSSDGVSVLKGGGNQIWVEPGSLTPGKPVSTGWTP